MNNAVFTGKLVEDATLRAISSSHDHSGGAVLEFDVRVKNKKLPKQPLLVKCVAYYSDFHKDVVIEKLKKNMKVTVSGEVYIHQWEVNEYVYSCFYLEISTMDIHYVPSNFVMSKPSFSASSVNAVVSDMDDTAEDNYPGNSDSSVDVHSIQDYGNYFQDADGVMDDVSRIDF